MFVNTINMLTKLALCSTLLLLVFGLNTVDSRRFFRGRLVDKYGSLGLPTNAPELLSSDKVKEEWFVQKLNHFDPTETRIWKQRYFVNFEHFNQSNNSPVFLQLGGEGEASAVWLTKGQIATNYGKHYGALLINLEHRYYGKSYPTEDMSTKNLVYLTSNQALQDAATFIEGFKQKHNLQNNKWIVFGGSYSGSLAAWFRLKYPHLVSGAIASSAPVQAVLDFSTYLKVVETSLGKKCVGEIREANQQLTKMLQIKENWNKISKIFKLCDPLDGNIKNDVMNLVSNLAGNFEGTVQYNKDNRHFEGDTSNITIDTICSVMTNFKDNSSAIDRYAQVNNIFLDPKTKCLDYKYQKFIKELSDISLNPNNNGRLWTYQTCVEFGFFQSSDYPNQPFGNYFPVEFFVEQCVDIFGAKFNQPFIQRSIDFTNNLYGGYNLTVDNVLFPNGLIDPWHMLGVLTEINPTSLPLIIKETAHCADMYPDSDNDPQSLRDARQKIKLTIGQFLNE